MELYVGLDVSLRQGIVRVRPCLSKALPAMAGLSAPARLTRASGIDRGRAERDPDPRRIWPGIYDASARQDDCARFGESETNHIRIIIYKHIPIWHQVITDYLIFLIVFNTGNNLL